MMKMPYKIACLIAVISTVSLSASMVQAQNFLHKLEKSVEGGVDEVRFTQWANQHPDWVSTHHDRYEYFMHHPDEANKFRSEWYGWHAEHTAQMNFSSWASQHPDWVSSHHDRYEYFMHHPDAAEHSRHEWAEYKAEQKQMNFSDWASHNPEWVESHRERYEHFKQHPDEAEHYRSEWSEWHH
jgi:hypothetical protein